MKFKEILNDYFKNMFNCDAPITKQDYIRKTWIARILCLPVILLLVSQLKDLQYSEAYYKMSEAMQQEIDLRHDIKFSLTFL
ncbi:hypothetical protein [Macrococcus lamae]|uniref:Uncharacterized protein n=1 Tax=Macrococcus lamae TaxID=198484 RepID=A0A4V3BF91_9STAP|nr:hypothetical protein [Macrococcus lamae]TDM10637.1 hypothetical protein ERX29_06220 [Macrococcus lamae]